MKHFFLTLLACLAIASCSAFDDDYFAEHLSKILVKKIIHNFKF